MSLHIGNLSHRIRKDQLERVFRRFGHCTVQLKDGYGFTVYDFRGDAEKALTALKGRKICGEQIYLSWSKKQPKPLQRFAKGARSRGTKFERNSNRVDNHVGHNFSRSHGNHLKSNKQRDSAGRKRKYTEARDDGRSYNHNNLGNKHHNQREDHLEEGGPIESNQLDDGRLVEHVNNLQNDNSVDEQMGFDRYEPDCGDEGGEEYGNDGLGHFDGSPLGEDSLYEDGRATSRHPDNMRCHRTCSNCGSADSKMCDCLPKDALQGKNSRQPDSGQHNETNTRNRGRGEDGESKSRSRERLQPNSRNYRFAKRHETGRKPSPSEQNGTKDRSPLVANESHRTKKKDYDRKGRREREDKISEKLDGKKSRTLASSQLHSDCTSPQLGKSLTSLRLLPGSSMQSRSRSPELHSLSVSSRSKSTGSRSSSIKSKSRSRSSSPSSLLSISPKGSLPSSSNKTEVNLNSPFGCVPSPQSKEVLTEDKQQLESDTREENMSVAKKVEASFNGHSYNSTSPQFNEVSMEREQLQPDSNSRDPTCTNCIDTSVNGSLKDDHILQRQEVLLEERRLFDPQYRETVKPQNKDMPVLSEDVSSSFEVTDDMMYQLHTNDGNTSKISCASWEIKIPSPALLEGVDKDSAADKHSHENLREVEELENANTSEVMESLKQANKPDLKASSNSHIGSNLSISAEELCKVLNHYGMKHPEDSERYLAIEDYFGSACLWPWEIIYYRRLKKGLISIENYARRVAQNKEFGIIDKYIRSSSGWGEVE